MAYVGTPIDTTNQFQSLQGKRFSGDASTTAFTLDIAPNSVFDIEVFVENVRQDPNSAYTLNGTTLTFSAAPPSGTNNIYVIHQAKAVGTITAPVGGSIDMNGVELILDEDGDTSITADTDDQIDFKTGGTDRARIDSSGNVFIGTTSTNTGVDSSSAGFYFRDGGQLRVARDNSQPIIANRLNGDGVIIDLRKDGDTVGQLSAQSGGMGINIGSSASEALRIDSSGRLLLGTTSQDGQVTVNYESGNNGAKFTLTNSSSASNVLVFNNTNGTVGYIQTNGSSTSYNTSSDYRLKENVDYTFDATSRLKQLKPARFNFKADADTTVDGFLAHEVSSIVPEAVTGIHNEVQVWEEGEELPEGVSVGDNKLDDEGNTIPKYQGIDQSKLVPLLVKTIQELEARVTTLEG